MRFNFTDYLNTRLDEKLGNLNATNDSQYKFVLKAVLQNRQWRGDLIGPGSKIVTLTGRGRTQFIKDLRDVQKKIDEPQLIFLTTEYKTLMIKNSDWGKYNSDSNSYTPSPINANWQTSDIVVSNNHMGDFAQGPVIPKVDIEKHVRSAKGNEVVRRLKNSLDNAALDDDTDYHAIVILPDLENVGKVRQRAVNRVSDDQYETNYTGKTRFMNRALEDAEKLRSERAAGNYNTHTMSFKDLYDILGNSNDNVKINGELYRKMFHDSISGYGYKFTVTSNGVIHICKLSDSTGKWRLLTYNVNLQQFIIE